MEELQELEQRLAQAMERIANGIGAMGDDPANDADALRAELEDERLANAQLQERAKKLSEQVEELRSSHADNVSALDTELQRLKRANEQLRQSNAALREANAAGVGDAHLINKAMMEEIEALRAMRAAEAAETASILGAMDSLLNEEEAAVHA